jgi:ferredoxin
MPASDRRYRLTVIPDRCQGHNRCHVLAPELIEIDDLGFAHAKGDGGIPAESLERARLAVRNCPEFALKLEPLDDGASS